jgi:hypothetical protein
MVVVTMRWRWLGDGRFVSGSVPAGSIRGANLLKVHGLDDLLLIYLTGLAHFVI